MNSDLSAIALRRIDAACDNFEAAWRAGRQPRIEEYLPLCEVEERMRLLDSLQKLQQELILKQMAGIAIGPSPVPTPSRSTNGGPGVRPQQPSSPISAPNNSITVGQVERATAMPGEQTQEWDAPRVIFRVVAGPHQGQEFVYDEHDTLLVGRSNRAQLRLKDDMHFSRHHFRMETNPPSCFIMDLGSRNGTFVNGVRIKETFLKDGDVVSGGRTKMAVSIREPRPQSSKPVVDQGTNGLGPAVLGTGAVTPKAQPVTAKANTDSRINGYELHEQLGTGDLGTVYRATRLATREVCALKIISPAARADEKSIQTFLREASILNQLQHQYIVRLIEMGASGAELFLSTEYLQTISWDQLSARWPFEQRVRIACGIMAQILGALEHAHARSMVHRDVKPGNVLISRINGKLVGKLADFGLAKHYTTAGMSQMTREGDVIGSLPYMSPEQFINSREAKPNCDLYSAGATLYWMISGKQPILLENHPCKFLAILEDPPVPLQSHCPEIPAELAQIIHRALEKTPEKRFTSASEMRQYVRRFAK